MSRLLPPVPVAALALAALALALPASTEAGVEGREASIALETEDGLTLRGSLVRPADLDLDRPLPTVIAVHSLGGSREDLEPLINHLNGIGLQVAAVDVRGHGQSRVTKNHTIVAFPYLAPPDLRRIVTDHLALAAWLADRPDVDPSRLAMACLGFGCHWSGVAAGRDPRVRALAIVGPAEPYLGGTSEAGVRAMGDRPVWLATSSDNPAWMEIAEDLAGFGEGERTVRGYESLARRTPELLEIEPLLVDLGQWLVEATAPPAP